MNLLTWVRGPLLWLSLAIFFTGIFWRMFSLWRLPVNHKPKAHERIAFDTQDAFKAAMSRMQPKGGFHPSATLVTINPYVFHIGIAVVFFGYAPHIAFMHKLTGLWWPALPDMVMYFAASATIVSLTMALLFRLTDPVLKRISSADDYISWTVTFLPFLTGMAVLNEPSSAVLVRDHVIYPTPLAIHLLSLELLLIWFPFGKLMHAFLVMPARMQLATFFGRRGVRS
jgi:nitrate reductase gamma subunit